MGVLDFIGGVAGGIGAGRRQKRAINENRRVRAEDRQWALEDYEKQKSDNLAFWEMENEYNSPDAQRRRLEEAGYNPALALGDVNSVAGAGSIESAPGISAPSQGAYDFGIDTFGSATSALGSMLSAQRALKENEGIDLDNRRKGMELGWAGARREEEARAANDQNRLANHQAALIEAQMWTQRQIEAKEAELVKLTSAQTANTEQATATSAAQEKYYGAGATNLESQTASNLQGIEESNSRMDVNSAQIGKLRSEIAILEKDLKSYDDKMRTQLSQQVAATELSKAQTSKTGKEEKYVGREPDRWWMGYKEGENPGPNFNLFTPKNAADKRVKHSR